MTLENGKPLAEGVGETMEQQIFLSGMLKKQKEFMARQ